MKTRKNFPEGMRPLEKNETFSFDCHSGVDCFMSCCKNVDMFLYPYDILRLKQFLKIPSQEFMENYTTIVKGVSHPYFPAVMLRLREDENKSCPFLTEEGCGVYMDRPSACRTYPLERGVDRSPEKGRTNDFYLMTTHDYCHGHSEVKHFIFFPLINITP